MDQYVKMSIDGRRQAIEGSYDLSGALKKKVDDLFKEIEKFGADCKDAGEFETKFSASPLNQKYTELFTEIATKLQMKGAEATKARSEAGRAMAGGIMGGIAESAAERAIGTVKPTRASINQHARDAVMGVPVLGDAIDIGQKASYAAHLGKVFGLGKRKKIKKMNSHAGKGNQNL